MKILFVNNSGADRGGTERSMGLMAKQLIADGHSVALICGRTLPYTSFDDDKVYQVNEKWLSTPTSMEKEALEFRKIIKKENPDLIHIENVRNPSVMSFANKMAPTVRSIRDLTALCVDNQAKVLRKSDRICESPLSWRCLCNAYSEKCTTRRPHRLFSSYLNKRREIDVLMKLCRIIVSSNYLKSCLVKNGIQSDKIETIPLFVPLPLEVQTNCRPGLILFAGNINWTKGLHYLIDALSKVKSDYELVVAGEGSEFEQTKSLGEKVLGSNRIRFLGFLENSDLGKYYSMCSFVVVPSIWPEAFGRVGLEAMAHARPVIAFRVGGIEEWLMHEETGFLVPRGDTETMARYIEMLLSNSELADSMGRAARTRVERFFTSGRYMNQLLNVYQETQSLWKLRTDRQDSA